MTSECQPNQAHSATVDRHVPIVITPDVVSSSTSEAVACFITTSVWDVRLQELAAYKEANGHTNVPSRFASNKPLGNWVQKQRQQYKLIHENEKSVMTPEHIESLNELDFEWVVRSASWERHLQELTIYKKQNNGKTYVSTLDATNKPLRTWVNTQKKQYKLFQENENSSMTPERIKSLNELDFEWQGRAVISTAYTSPRIGYLQTAVWDTRLQELVTYKQVNGHTNVPQRCPSNKPLGSWVKTQRNQYKLLREGKMREGKNSHMTKERMESLNELDFEWSSGSETSTPWEQRLQELAAYKEANGSTNVPQVFPSNKQLGIWVKTQRCQYKLLHKNEKSTMTKERMESLNELDFDWTRPLFRS
jgi:glutaredoxin